MRCGSGGARATTTAASPLGLAAAPTLATATLAAALVTRAAGRTAAWVTAPRYTHIATADDPRCRGVDATGCTTTEAHGAHHRGRPQPPWCAPPMTPIACIIDGLPFVEPPDMELEHCELHEPL